MDQREQSETQQISGCGVLQSTPKGKVSSGAPWEQHGTCGWQRHGAEDGAGLSWFVRDGLSIYTNTYIRTNTYKKE